MGFGNAKAERPYTKTIKWKSGNDAFEYYDGENNVAIEIESFTVLEELVSVSGYSQNAKQGIWSNEVLSLDDDLHVKVGNDVVCSGKWKDIKTEVAGKGGKFTNVVIALLPDGEVVRLLFAGAGCSGWIGKKFNPMSLQCGVTFAGSYEDKNGSVTFNVPEFGKKPLSAEETEAAMEAWKSVDAWLKDRGQQRPDEQDQSHGYDESIQPEPANNAFAEAAQADNPFSSETPF